VEVQPSSLGCVGRGQQRRAGEWGGVHARGREGAWGRGCTKWTSLRCVGNGVAERTPVARCFTCLLGAGPCTGWQGTKETPDTCPACPAQSGPRAALDDLGVRLHAPVA
jgi:hypothetical protein